MHALDFLVQPQVAATCGCCVVFGADRYLRSLVLERLPRWFLGAEQADIPFARFDGSAAQWRDVRDELTTVSLFGVGRRLALVEEADDFVSRHRAQLEQHVAQPGAGSTLVLDVQTWPANTRLYKAVDQAGLAIDCGVPEAPRGRGKQVDEPRIVKWLVDRSRQHHGIALGRGCGELLLELVGTNFGLLDQELARLASYCGAEEKVTPEIVQQVAGGWRTKTTWEMLEAAADGSASEALRQLDQLLQSGTTPQAIFGAMSWSLRRFADATRLVQNHERRGGRIALPAALQQAGFRKFPPGAIERGERQLRQIGRHRGAALYRWLLDADLALKGSHSAPHRLRQVLETLIVRLSREAAGRSTGPPHHAHQ
jgi:DNA polymerase-3 subunit delta